MRPLTDATHKALLSVGDESLLARMVAALLALEIEAITVVTGHRAPDLEAHLGERFPGRAVGWVHSPDHETTNNIVSLDLALRAIPRGTGILVLEADVVFDAALLQRLVVSPHANVALLAPWQPGLDGTVATVEDGVVTALIPGGRARPAEAFKTVNLYKLGAAFCDQHLRRMLTATIEGGGADRYYEVVLGALVHLGIPSARLHAEIVEGEAWMEIDNPDDLDLARFAFEPLARRERLDTAYGGLWRYPVTDFCYPRNLYFPNAAALEELRARLPDLTGQYGSAQSVLDEVLGRYLRQPPTRAVLLNGLSQIFPILRRWYADRPALIPAPTFGEFARAFPGAATYRDGPGVDFAEVEAKAPAGGVVVFVNPNNPTGSWLARERIMAFARAHPDKTVLVDESFADFSSQPDVLSGLAEAPQNLVVLKSLGKALGVTGLRLGFAAGADAAFLADLRAELPVWNINAPAEAFLRLTLRHRRDITGSFVRTRADREAFADALAAHPLVERAWPSEGNFILTRLKVPVLPAFLDALLAHHGLYLKDVSDRFADPGAWVRLAVRTPTDNRRLLDAMLAEAPV